MANAKDGAVPVEGTSGTDMEERDAAKRIEEAEESRRRKQVFRETNLKPERPDDSFFRSLDSSVKRNTATIKKLRAVSEETRPGLVEELKSVNLSKYISEAVAAIVEAKLKTADIDAAVQVCSLLHIRYKHFTPQLVEALLKIFVPPPKGAAEAEEKGARLSKRRTALRLLTELLIAGVVTDSAALVGVIKELAKPDQAKDRDAAQAAGTLLVAFLKQAKEPLRLASAAKDTPGPFSPPVLTDAESASILGHLGTFYTAAEALLLTEHKALRTLEAENAAIMTSKGELSEETTAAYEKQRKAYEQLLRTLSSLAELLERPPPALPEDDTTRVTSGPAASVVPAGKEPAGPEPIWDDEDMRTFYEDLPDLRAFVPAVLLGEAEPKTEEPSKSDAGEAADGDEKGSPDKKGASSEKEAVEGEDKGLKNAQDNAALEALLQRLPKAGSRDLVDQIAVEVCYLNSKGTRKKLVRALFAVPRTALELVPYYSRLAATLASVMKDVAPMLVAMLEEEFNFLLPKKDQSKIETKIRNVHFLGELAKFKLAPPSLIFMCLRAYLDDLSGSNIDAACHLLESCGRFLYRTPDTSVRMSNLLDVLMRLKNAKNLDARQSTMVDNAFFQCKPPDRPATVVKHRPPLQEYIRRLIYTQLSASTIETVLRQLRKLPWGECSGYVAKVLGRVHKLQYANIHLVASLAAGFTKFHDDLPVTLVDQILEEIRAGLEDMGGGLARHQRRVAQMRFLGELYNYRIVDSPIVFDTLYLLLNYGVGTAQEAALDPPGDVFRIRLVLTLLETCGQFFDRGAAKRRLDRFLLYFQRYLLSKAAIPLDVEFDLQDTLASLRPKLIRLPRLEMALQAVAQQEAQEAALAEEEATRGIPPGPPEKAPKGRKKTIASRIADGSVSIVEGDTKGEWGEGEESESDDGSGSERGGDKEDQNEGKAASDTEEEPGAGTGGEDTEGEGDEYVRVRQRAVSAEEEAEFDKELRAMVQESVEARKFEVRKGAALELAMPINIGAQKPGEALPRPDADAPAGGKAFRLVTRRGAKQQTRELIVPESSRLAISSRQKDDAEQKEKQALKRIVLDYEEARASNESDFGGGAVRTGTRVLNKGGLLFSNSGARGRGGARGGGRHVGGGRGEVRNQPVPEVEETWQE